MIHFKTRLVSSITYQIIILREQVYPQTHCSVNNFFLCYHIRCTYFYKGIARTSTIFLLMCLCRITCLFLTHNICLLDEFEGELLSLVCNKTKFRFLFSIYDEKRVHEENELTNNRFVLVYVCLICLILKDVCFTKNIAIYLVKIEKIHSVNIFIRAEKDLI